MMDRVESMINLIPSENDISWIGAPSLAKVSYGYHLPTNIFNCSTMPGRENLHEFLSTLRQKLCLLYSAKWVDFRPFSGMHMMVSLLVALNHRFTNIFTLGRGLGGHSLTEQNAKKIGYSVSVIPVTNKYEVDYDHLKTDLKNSPPTILYLDQSVALQLLDIEKYLNCAKDSDIVFYDVSHVNLFWLLTQHDRKIVDDRFLWGGSMHKSFPGPTRALFGSSLESEYTKEISEYLDISVSNLALPSLYYLDFMSNIDISVYDKYAKQVIENSNLLAESLCKTFNVRNVTSKKFSKTHQILVDTGEPVFDSIKKLASCGVLSYRGYDSHHQDHCLRFGSQYITTQGYKPEDIGFLATAIISAVNGSVDDARTITRELLENYERKPFFLSHN